MQLKTLVVGDRYVGKSSFVLRLGSNIFQNYHFGFEDYAIKISQLGEQQIKLFVWDYPRQYMCSSSKNFYRRLNGIFFLYDISNRKSFENIQNWIKEFCDNNKENIKTIQVLIGCKCDLEDLREVKYDEGLQFAIQSGLLFFETSSKSGINVEKSLEDMREQIFNII